jgi:glutaredoxin 3
MGNIIQKHKETTDARQSMAKAVVDEAIRANPVMVFSKSYCPYCTRAKRALESVLPREKITVMELDQRPDCGDIQDYLLSITGGRSVPRVFIAGTFIGGGDDTEAMARSGKLKELLLKNNIL